MLCKFCFSCLLVEPHADPHDHSFDNPGTVTEKPKYEVVNGNYAYIHVTPEYVFKCFKVSIFKLTRVHFYKYMVTRQWGDCSIFQTLGPGWSRYPNGWSYTVYTPFGLAFLILIMVGVMHPKMFWIFIIMGKFWTSFGAETYFFWPLYLEITFNIISTLCRRKYHM